MSASPDIDPDTAKQLKGIGRRMGIARAFALAAFVAFIVGLVYEIYITGRVQLAGAADIEVWVYFESSLLLAMYFAPFIVFSALAYFRTGDMYGAAKRGEVFFLKKLNSFGWGLALFFLSNPVTGVILMGTQGSITQLKIPPEPPYQGDVVLGVDHLVKFFPVRRTISQSITRKQAGNVHAVDDVSFGIKRAQVFGLAGESGSGKTTALRTALLLTRATSGSISFKGKDLSEMSKGELAKYRIKVQVVFQDPYESLNPRMPVFDLVAEGLLVNNLVSSHEEAIERVTAALRDVQITPPEDYLFRYPHELSGGQRQRVAIARALVLEPELIFADEPVSMLDVSIRAEVINALLSAREKRGISIIMVTHDLALSKDMVDELGVMYVGKIVEQGPAQDVVLSPYHPYTRALVAAVPVPDPEGQRVKVLARGEIPTNVSPPPGCRFHPRCAFAQDICTTNDPALLEVVPGRRVACHFWKEAHEAFEKGLDGPVGAIEKS